MEPAALFVLAAAALSGLPPAPPAMLRRAVLVAFAVWLVVAAGPVGAALGPPPARPMGERPGISEVQVEPGDSLWTIAVRLLASRGIDRSTEQVDRYWRALYETNRTLIGPDPDLIHPGQRLVVPSLEAG